MQLTFLYSFSVFFKASIAKDLTNYKHHF